MKAWRASLLGLAVVVTALAPATSSEAGEPTGRVLVLSLPTLTWDELYRGDTPALDALLDDSAVAAMSVRDVLRHTTAGDGYAAMSVGAPARGVPTDGDVLEPDEDYRGTTAADEFERTTGHHVTDGLLALGFPALEERNDGLDYGAEVGALGQALEDASVPHAAVANADEGGGPLLYERTAAIALVDRNGVVPDGQVRPDLLEPAPSFPYGVQLDIDAVDAAFRSSWERGGVVLVEGSDLARANRYLGTRPRIAEIRRNALRHTDALIGDLLRSVDPDRDSVLVVAPYHRSGEVTLTVAGLHTPRMEPGLLQSGSTRRKGIVTLVDIAPTILDLVGVDRPGSMEGRRFERAGEGASTGEARAADLADLDAASQFRDRMVTPVAGLFVVLQALLWIGAAFALRGVSPFWRSAAGLAALTMLAYLPATYLARLFDFHDAEDLAYWAFVFAAAIALAVLSRVIGRRNALDPLLICLMAIFGLLTIDMLIGAPLQLNAVFGYSPTVGGRFAGMGNLAYGMYAASAFLLCGLISRRLAPRDYATMAGFSVLVVAVLIDGMPFWGSDVGGVLAMVPAVGVTAARMFGQRLRWRTAILWGSLAVALVGVFALVDLSRPSDKRTHLGRLVEAIGDEGFGAFWDVVQRKLDANFSVIASSVWTAMVPVALGFIIYLLWRAPGHLREIRGTIEESLPGLAVVGVLGFAFNDSGIAVPGVMLGVVNASLVYLTVRTLSPEAAPP